MKIYEPKTKEDFRRYYDLRWRILRASLNQPKGTEKDELEDESIHIIICEDNRVPLGIGRLHFNSKAEAQIRYMAVEEGRQGKGIGTMVLKELEKRAKEKGAKRIILKARENAVKFYEKHNYNIIGKAHTLFRSIIHFKMEKIF